MAALYKLICKAGRQGVRGKEDPNAKIDQDERLIGQTFMALNGVDLTVYKGEALGIIGGNGAGKSTLLKLLSRVTAPTAGEIGIYGRVASMPEVGTGFSGEMTGSGLTPIDLEWAVLELCSFPDHVAHLSSTQEALTVIMT